MKITKRERELLQEVLEYDEESGELIWREQLSIRAKVGSIAGTIDKSGYKQVCVKGKVYKVGRLVWFLIKGEDISNTSMVIHYKNRNLSDNRLDNLELVSRSELAKRRIYQSK